jgi:hypothetical protein
MTLGVTRSRDWLFLFGVVMLAAGGCVQYTPALPTTYRPSADLAYLYGRFSIESESHALAADGYATMGFKLECIDGRTITIRFSNKPRLQVIEVNPGVCQMTEIVFSDGDGGIKGRRLAPSGWMGRRKFEAGRAYYLGDYGAEYSHEWKVFTTQLSWKLTSEENDYASSTKELAATFAGFAGMTTEDKSFVSAAPKARPPRRPAGAPSPSPQQIARAAPLIRRTFSTPVACEADCTTGDCLPFRGPDGPAMTCIVYCRSDEDCPDRFTCNVPSRSARQDPSANTPELPLTGICLAADAAAASE